MVLIALEMRPETFVNSVSASESETNVGEGGRLCFGSRDNRGRSSSMESSMSLPRRKESTMHDVLVGDSKSSI